MKISIIGAGYVGLITGTCFAELGNEVTCVEIDRNKVEKINRGEPPIYEEGLEEMLNKNIGKRLKATFDTEGAVLGSDITFIAVGTPDAPNGGIDLRYVKSAAEGVGKALAKKKSYHTVVVKSTVIPGTTDSVVMPILELESGKKAGDGFGLCMNPEFLREGKAIWDFMNPDRIVIGALDAKSGNVLDKLYQDLDCPKLRTDLRTAEMIKYAANAMLATRISFMNEIANICELVGTDVVDVAKGIGMDKRIGPHFLQAGAGYGGSCFPKDVKAVAELAKKHGYKPILLESVMEVNVRQAEHIVRELGIRMGNDGLEGKRVAVLGLAFKPGTDDVREAPALRIIPELIAKGAVVVAYDPIAMKNAEAVFGADVEYAKSIEDCLDKADACMILTEWPEFRLAPEVFKKKMSGKVVIDGRRILDTAAMRNAGFDYYGVGYGR